MGSTFGHLFRVTTFGESHGSGVGVVVDGCPPGLAIDREHIQADLDRRRPGSGALCTPRSEHDRVEILSGVHEGRTLGTPIAMLVRNEDARPEDYDSLEGSFRPGHADHTTEAKYGRRDPRGGGRSSARETVGRVAAGAVARRLLEHELGTEVLAWVDGVGDVRAGSIDPEAVTIEQIFGSPILCPDQKMSLRMEKLILTAKEAGDSVGATIGCVARSVPAGWGEPVFDKLTAELAKALMSIPAARGFEMGEGFAAASMRGSEHNEALIPGPRGPRTARNLSGGVNGGISNGESLRMRVAFKPPSSISLPQQTVTSQGERRTISLEGRHDPCVAPRAVPVVEAMVLLVLADHHLRQRALRQGPAI